MAAASVFQIDFLGHRYCRACCPVDRSNRKVAKYFSYDGYWLEFGAVRNQNADYALPLARTHKDMKDVPTKRRAKYRRQHALLEAIQQDTIRIFECPAASCANLRVPCEVEVNVNLKQPHAETKL